jgi:DNA-directed RNA polymerase specialized sigma24 family protein
VQEANLVAMNKMGDLKLQDHGSIIQWLSQIVINKIRDANDYFSAQKRDVDRVANVDFDPGAMPANSNGGGRREPSPVERAGLEELRQVLDEAMIQLPEDLREVILLRDYYSADWAYVSRESGIRDEAEVQKLHRRAWINLRRIVGPRMDSLL